MQAAACPAARLRLAATRLAEPAGRCECQSAAPAGVKEQGVSADDPPGERMARYRVPQRAELTPASQDVVSPKITCDEICSAHAGRGARLASRSTDVLAAAS